MLNLPSRKSSLHPQLLAPAPRPHRAFCFYLYKTLNASAVSIESNTHLHPSCRAPIPLRRPTNRPNTSPSSTCRRHLCRCRPSTSRPRLPLHPPRRTLPSTRRLRRRRAVRHHLCRRSCTGAHRTTRMRRSCVCFCGGCICSSTATPRSISVCAWNTSHCESTNI